MKYRTIVADPPWSMPSGGPRGTHVFWRPGVPSALPYTTMSVREIAALPVDELADSNAHLYLWTPNTFLEYAWDIARDWKFRPSQVLVWAKKPRGLGLGGAFTNTTEFILFAWRGELRAQERIDSTWWQWKRGEHSRKPEAFIDMAERVSPAPRLEMFARRQRLGWDTWGDEAFEHVTLEVPA